VKEKQMIIAYLRNISQKIQMMGIAFGTCDQLELIHKQPIMCLQRLTGEKNPSIKNVYDFCWFLIF
jgi:hypothetical protein